MIDKSLDSIRKTMQRGNMKYDFYPGIDISIIEKYETALGIKFGNSFKKFLNFFNGGLISRENPSFYTDMTEWEPDSRKWSSFYFFSLDEIANRMIDLRIDELFLPDKYNGNYPFFPFCRLPGEMDDLLLLSSEKDINLNSPVFLFKDKKKSMKLSDSFDEFLNWYVENNGFPPINNNLPGISIYEWANKNSVFEKHICNDIERDKERLDAYISIFPDDNFTYSERSNILRRMGRLKEALKDINHAIQVKPNDSWYYYCRAEIFSKNKEYRKALIDYDSAVTLKPDDKLYLYGRAETFFELGKLDLALADCNKILNQYYLNELALMLRFKVYKAMGEDELAQADSDLLDDLSL